MKKKVLAALLCAAMGATLLAGCGNNASEGGASNAGGTEAAGTSTSDEGETIKIGVELYDPSDDQCLAMQKYFDYLEENMNIEFVYSEALADASAELDFINSCASAGCQGIIGYYNVAEGEAVQAAIDKGMYYWGTEAIYEQFKDNDHYVGCYTHSTGETEESGDFLGGYELAYSLGKAGVKHVFYCNGGASMGIPMFVDRQNGFLAGIEAAQKDGYEIQYDPEADVVEGWPDSPDFASAVGAKIAGDYDGAAASFNAAALFQPLGEAGKLGTGEFKLATIGEVCDTYLDFVDSQTVASVVYDCEEIMFGNSVVELVNAIKGNRLTNADGTALKILAHRWTVTDPAVYHAIYDFHEAGNFFVSADDIKTLTADGVTGQQVYDFYAALDMDTAALMIK